MKIIFIIIYFTQEPPPGDLLKGIHNSTKKAMAPIT